MGIKKGDTVTIEPEVGPVRVMRVAHVEWHIITLSDIPEPKDSAGGERDNRSPRRWIPGARV